MKVAVPVHNDTLKVFGNAGHAPYFAMFDVSKGGAFYSIGLDRLIANPRANPEAEDDCELERSGHCNHDRQHSEAHKEEHRVMAEAISGCEYLIAVKACKNTKAVMSEAGIKVATLNGYNDAKALIGAFLRQK
ncbi:MAG: hypothetical protein LBN32_03335 [Helicobacteraceae bacterium]|jgi:predicted Fe-Mo cluster-binding NifX family protein|nr:hypothetical protein [Helicobacteraceae bacterium]